MEYCELGDLSTFIKNKNTPRNALGGLPEDMVYHFVGQLASAMEFLRVHSLIHRDIKPQNILMSKNNASVFPLLKIADFGFARALPSTSMASTLCGSPLYMAPEILKGDKYDAKSDLWSLGAVLYECMLSRPPFRAQNHIELLKKIEMDQGAKFPDESTSNTTSPNPRLNESFKDLVRKLLKKNPVERISFEEFLLHPCVLSSPGFVPCTLLSSSSSPGVGLSTSQNVGQSLENSIASQFSSKSPKSYKEDHSSLEMQSHTIQSNSFNTPSDDLEAPFPGYNINALIFHNPEMSQSKTRGELSNPEYVLIEKKTETNGWIQRKPSKSATTSTLISQDLTISTPWNPSKTFCIKQHLQSEDGIIQLYAICGYAYEYVIQNLWNLNVNEPNDLEEIVMLDILCLEFYQVCLDLIRKTAFKRMITMESKTLFEWVESRFNFTLKYYSFKKLHKEKLSLN